MQNQKAILNPEGTYHIYNRANGDGQLFLSEENYRYFLRKFDEYRDLTGFENLSGLVSNQFRNFFNAYSKAFNKQQNRKGSLFTRPFKRKMITDNVYFRKLVHYIHYNPLKARLAVNPEEWDFSSYKSMLSKKPTHLKRSEVISYFDDLSNFKYCHNIPPDVSGINI